LEARLYTARMPTPRSGRRRADPGSVAVTTPDAHLLTETVTKLRRALRASIRTDIPWETLPMAQVELLQTLAEAAPARVSDLAEQLHLANSTVSGLIAQMIDSRLVQRQTDPDDRRAAVVTLTAAGQAQLADWEQAHEHRIGLALEQLSAKDRQAIIQALRALARLTELLNEPDVAPREQT
jgi:DNA-binding MarR family transcriptional regulator